MIQTQKSTLSSAPPRKRLIKENVSEPKKKTCFASFLPLSLFLKLQPHAGLSNLSISQPQVRVLPSSHWDCCGLCMGMVSCLCSQLDPSKAHLTPSPLPNASRLPYPPSVWHICPHNPNYFPSNTLGFIPILTLHFLYTQGTYYLCAYGHILSPMPLCSNPNPTLK